MKIFLTGLPDEVNLDALKARLSEFGPVRDIHVLKEGMGADPIWVVEMNVDPGTATRIALKIDHIWFQGKFIHARVPPQQD